MPVALAVSFAVVIALLLLIALSQAYTYTLGALLRQIAGALNSVKIPTGIFGPIHLLGWAADAITAMDNGVRHAFGVGITYLQDAWNYSSHYTATAIEFMAREVAYASLGSLLNAYAIEQTLVPHWIRKRLKHALVTLGGLAAAHAVLHTRVVTRIERIVRVVTHKVTVIQRLVTVPNTATIPRTIPKVGQLEREMNDVLRRGRELLKRLTPAAIIAGVLAAVGTVGAGWMRCSKVGRAGRNVCGMNEDLLASLLADTLLIVGTLDIVVFAEAMQTVTADGAGAIKHFWRADRKAPVGHPQGP
jgi:hypothetical protein